MKNLNLINPERRLGGHDFCGVNHANQTEVQTDNLSVSGRSEVSMTLDEQPCNHPLLPKQKSGKSLIRIGKNVAESHVRKYAGASRVWKYAAMVVLMLCLGVGEMWAYNEYNKKYLYFNGSEFTSFFNDACTPYINAKWDYAGTDATNNGGNKEMTQIGTSYFYYLDLSLASSSYKSFRGFYIGRSASFHNGAMMGYVDGSTDNCIKATSWGTYEWSKYAPPMASATLTNTSVIYGGDGTSENPYKIKKGTTLSVSASATSSVPDDNQTKYYQFYKKEGDGTRSTLGSKTTTSTASFTASSSADVIYEIDVVAQNEYYSTYGTGATSDKIYFITVDPIYAILGSFNSWDRSAVTWDLSDKGSNNWDATFHLDKGNHTFKVVFNSVHNGNGATITRASNSTTGLSSSGNNMTITADVSGDYTFRYNTSGSLTVTYPTAYTVTYGKGTGGASVSASATSAGGTFSSGALVRSGDVVSFTQTAATGYSFKGWYTASSGGTDAGVDEDGHLTINAAKTVYAQYDPMDYVITLDKNTGSANGSVTATYNSTATKSFTAVTKTGYDCTGYWTAESGGYKVVNANGTLVSYSSDVSTYLNTNGTWKKTDATTLYAQWTAQTYTITLDENGDYQGNGSATATYDSGLSGISLPSRTGYHVEGYYKEDTYTNKIANADGTLCATTDYTDASSHWTHVGAVTLYTKWTANTYTVHFDPNDENYVGDATGSMEDQGFTYDAAQALTTNGFTRAGYDFNGWNTNADGTSGTNYTDGQSVSNLTDENGGSVTLYAKWTAKDYDVTLNYGMGERGTNPASITVTMGATYVSSSDLTSLSNHLPTLADASGYYFTGWYTSPSGGTKITDETIVTTASAHTLYARFVERSYVYFYNNLGWENVYVVFNAYWTDNQGVGSNGREKLLMEHIGNNIWRYLIPEYALKTEWQHFIAFSNTNAVDGSHHFYSGKAVFRKDFDSYATMFVPASGGTTFVPSQYSGAGNGITYYSTDQWDWNASSPRHKDGYWKRYNSTEGGYTIKGSWDSWANDNYLKSVTTDGWTYSFSKYLDANTTYQFLLYKHCTTSNTATSTFTAYPTNTITSSACTDIKFTTQNVLLDGDDKNSKITTTAAGEYVFTLTCGTDGTLKLSVKYPLTANQEYRVLYSWTNNGNDSTHASEYIHAEPGTSKKISVFVHKSSAVTSRSLTIQKCTAIDGSGNPTWTNGNTIDLSSVGESGVYNFVITQPASGEPTGAYSEPYTGDYYIRTDAADGGWDFYKEIGDNKMRLSEFSLTQELSDPYSHYYCKFINSTSTNITYQIATDYSPCVSEVMVGDATIGSVSTKTLPATANVRFSWNCKTNALRRAYLKDAQGDSNARYLVLHGADGKILNTDGTAIAASDDLTENELQFTDNGNWVYQVSLKAQPGANVCLIANYNSADRYLVGDGSSEWLTIMGGSGTSKYDITAVYDFKTNRLMTAWTPSGVIKDQLEDVDVMLVRHAQDNANTITFAENKTTHKMGSLTANKIIGALEMRHDELFGHVTNWTSDSRPLLKFMVSFPFDVNVSDVFGLNSAYGEAYVIERYAGDERAAKGFFRGDGTSTFWTELEPGDVMKANEGYCVILDNEYFNGDLGKVWENKGTGSKVYLYFPSASNVGAINATEKSYTVPAHTCEINRTFGSPAKNHMNTDSHWNLIGVPIFANHAASSAEGTPGAVLTNEGDYFHHFYAWNPTDNQFYIATASSTVFKAMYSYMVQYHGDIKFVGAATPTPSSVAARRAPEKKNYEIELQVLNNDAEMINRTYVELRDEAEDGFMLNEDVYMSTNNKAVNIYTFAGNYDVAANVQSVNNHTIPVGVIVNKTGTYSFSMPSNFDGTVTLIDNFTQTRTNLALEDYEIQLEKGTINDRFLLEIDIHKVSTAIDGVTDGTGSLKDGKAHKFIENGIFYILRDGEVFDARGTKVK